MEKRGLIAREGYTHIAVAFVLFLISYVFEFPCLITVVLFGFLVFTVAFFRDPPRPNSGEPHEVLCPADGTIVRIERCEEDRFLGGPSVKVDIFMSPFNVHVNRMPLSGTVEEVKYNPGKYFKADVPKASLENEQNVVILDAGKLGRIAVNQIAGFVARRIVCYAKAGDKLTRGIRYGMIRFGSRVDVHMPPDVKLTCALGERVYAGDTILGVLPNGDTQEKNKS